MENNKPTILTDSVIARNEAIQEGSTISGLPHFARNGAKRRIIGAMLLIVLLFSASSCRFSNQVKEEKVEVDNLMRYARNVVVSEQEYGYLMEVICPWDTTLSLGKFALVKDTTKAIGEELTQVRVPVQSVVSFSATQWAVFLRLGEIDRIKGILEGRFVTDSTMRSLLAEEKETTPHP